jgi:putative phosphoribosyl transferase
MLLQYRADRPVVLGIARGGVPVAFEIARRFDAPLDVLIVRKVGAPDNPEYGLGAVAEGGTRLLDEKRIREAGYSLTDLEPYISEELLQVERQLRIFRGSRPRVQIRDRTVIIADDGVATGGTVRAAIQVVRAQHPRQLVLAVGVSPEETFRRLKREVDDLVVLLKPRYFYAVGQFYRHFESVEDEEVQRCLSESPVEVSNVSS